MKSRSEQVFSNPRIRQFIEQDATKERGKPKLLTKAELVAALKGSPMDYDAEIVKAAEEWSKTLVWASGGYPTPDMIHDKAVVKARAERNLLIAVRAKTVQMVAAAKAEVARTEAQGQTDSP